jgi:hypothetical protein
MTLMHKQKDDAANLIEFRLEIGGTFAICF